jgi:hypothetical protein
VVENRVVKIEKDRLFDIFLCPPADNFSSQIAQIAVLPMAKQQKSSPLFAWHRPCE